MKRVLTYIKHINRTQIVWGMVLVAVLAGGGVFFFRSAPAKQQTAVLAPKAFLQQGSVSGKVVASKQVDLGFSQSGRVTGVYAAVGRYASQGATLAVIENGDLRAAAPQKEAGTPNHTNNL